jgi:hypothetical protein
LGAHSKQSRRITFISPTEDYRINRTAETYVDDTELLLESDEGTIYELANEMQELAQYCWEQLLHTTTGGALALEKCFYVTLDWHCEKENTN